MEGYPTVRSVCIMLRTVISRVEETVGLQDIMVNVKESAPESEGMLEFYQYITAY